MIRAAALATLFLASCVAVIDPPPVFDTPGGGTLTLHRAHIRAERIGHKRVTLGTAVTNALPHDICIRDVAARAFFASGRAADLVFPGLRGAFVRRHGGRELRLAPGGSLSEQFTADLAYPVRLELIVPGDSEADKAAAAEALRRDIAVGAYVFELSFTYRICAPPPGQPAPWVSLTLGRSGVVHLP